MAAVVDPISLGVFRRNWRQVYYVGSNLGVMQPASFARDFMNPQTRLSLSAPATPSSTTTCWMTHKTVLCKMSAEDFGRFYKIKVIRNKI